MKGNNRKRNGYIGLVVLIVLTAVTIIGSDPLYKAIDNMARPAIYTPGTYTGTARGYGGTVSAAVTVSAKAIESIEVTGDKETLLDQVVPALTDKIVSSQNTQVDAVAGATLSSKAIQKAVDEALALARGEVPEEETVAGSEEEQNTSGWSDGKYSYEAPEYDDNGYKDLVEMTIESGVITTLSWDSVSQDGKKKSQLSMDGTYTMTEDGLKWYEQSDAVVNYVLKQQSLDGLVNAEGYTDAVSGVSINLFGFVNGVKACLSQAAGVADVILHDGDYQYESAEPDNNGFKDLVTMTVEGGAITALAWDCVNPDGSKKSSLSMDGAYVMTENGPKWHEQAQSVVDYVLENQSLKGLIDGDGYTDTVSGVSINLFGFVNGVESCLQQAAKGGVVSYQDGSYQYEAETFDDNGYKDVINMTVQDGAITALVWDSVNEAGVKKSQLSLDGSYVMTDTGLKWHEQAQAVADYVLTSQTTDGLINAEGYTDTVSGVSINLYGFINGVKECLRQAGMK